MTELDNDRLVWMYTQMLRIREFEERVKSTFEEHPGVIRGHTHLADGAEASIVGSLAAIEAGDQLMATYRCHGYPIALGTDTKAIMAEIYGRQDGLCGGYGGSMHLCDPGRGFLGTSGIVGQGIPQATGVAFAAQLRKHEPGRPLLLRRRRVEAGRVPRVAQPRLAVEAAGRLHHGEQQLQRRHARRSRRTPTRPPASRCRSRPRRTACPASPSTAAIRWPCTRPSARPSSRARRGEGPTLVESKVYRLSAHGNLIAPPGVPLHYPEHEAITVFGNREEYEAALRGDPVPRFRMRLVEQETPQPRARRRDRAGGPRRDGRAPCSSRSTARSRRRKRP